MSKSLKHASIAAICLIAVGIWIISRSTKTDRDPPDDTFGALQTRQSIPHERPTQDNDASVRLTTVALPDAHSNSPASLQARKLDPRVDGWDGEVHGDSALAQLKTILAGALPGEKGLPLAPDFSSTALRPPELSITYEAAPLEIRRGIVSNEFTIDTEEGLRSELRALGTGPGTRIKTKIVTVEPGESGFTTEALVELLHVEGEKRTQVTARWKCQWESTENSVPAKEPVTLLQRLTLLSYEEATAAAGSLLEDITASVLPDDEKYHGLVLRGINHWAARLTKIDDLHIFGHHGIAIGDANGDGLEDLYVCDGGGLPNRLYLQNADGTARDASSASGVDWLEESRGALFLDLDNDGDQDLVLTTVALVLLMENDGKGSFKVRGGISGQPDPYSLAAADYDNDGDIDLFVCNYSARPSEAGRRGFEATSPIPYHDATNGGRNTLLRNNGKFSFTDMTAEAGLEASPDRWSFAAAWDDIDNDGDQDLYVANDFGRNSLFLNETSPGGPPRFREAAAELGLEDMASGMSVAWGDYNRDGRMDLYVGNMFSAAGNRITFQRRFTGARPDTAVQLQRMARGNTLFRGDEDGSFRDVSESAAVTMGRWAWGSLFADLNNDGWQDLLVSNGYLTNELTEDL
ncbi:MAG: hypothetical protein CMP28_03860 [Roseibacillus sp.]|nr:hypothetical protein [Roseibacillus sp.]